MARLVCPVAHQTAHHIQRLLVRVVTGLSAVLAVVLTLALLACPGAPVQTCEGEDCDEVKNDNPPMLYVTPVFGLGFDCVAIGCQEGREVTVENRGGGTLTLTQALLTAGTSPDFSLRPSEPLPLDLGPDQGTQLTVTYRPLDAEKDYGLLRLITAALPPENAIAGAVELPLRVRQNGDPILGLFRENDNSELVDIGTEDNIINFGYVEGGTVGEMELIIKNLTSGNAILELNEVVPGTQWEPAFEIAELQAEDHLVNPDSELRLPLKMMPGSAQSDLRLYNAELMVRSSDPVYPEVTIRIFGTAMNVALMEVLPAVVDMGSTRYQSPKSALITLRNEGGLDLYVTPRLVGGANVGFAVVDDDIPLDPIGPFAQTTVEVTLDASVGGPVNGTLRLLSNDPFRPQMDIPLQAFVEAPLLVVEPDPIAFSALVQSWSAAPISALVSNNGHGPLSITNIYFEVGSSAQFSFLGSTPNFPITLLPEDPPLELQVAYTAFTLGPGQAMMVLESNSIDYVRSEVMVTGTGVTCEEGCVMPHGTPNCFNGECEVGSCDAYWHDADLDHKNGCECRQDDPEPGAFCSGGQAVGTIEDATRTRSGNLHAETDVDTFWFFAKDHSDFCFPGSDDGYIRVDFTSAPAGVEFCVSYVDHQPSGDGCGLGSEQCGLTYWKMDNTSCGRDDDRDVTVRVRATPGVTPGCAAYTVRFKSSM